MSRPSTRRSVWVAIVVALVTAGGLVTWSVIARSSDSHSESAPGARSDARSARTPEQTPPPTESLAPLAEPAPSVAPVSATELLAAAESVAPPEITLGMAVLDVDTGELVVGDGGTRPFMSASLAKLIVAVDVLDRHRAEGRSVDPADLDLITRALASSDDNAMNVLWGKHDGAGAVSRVATRLALTASIAPESSSLWGDTTVTAKDMVTVYGHVLRTMAKEDSAVIVNALAAATAVAADGFAQHYGLLHDGASPQRYAKQAWVPYGPAGYLLHSAGVARDERTDHTYAIALLSIQPYSSADVARDRLSSVAAAATALLTG
jgi:hypothetical protein